MLFNTQIFICNGILKNKNQMCVREGMGKGVCPYGDGGGGYRVVECVGVSVISVC